MTAQLAALPKRIKLTVDGAARTSVMISDWGSPGGRYSASLFGPPSGGSSSSLAFISGERMRVEVDARSAASLWIDGGNVCLKSIAEGERIAATFNVGIERAVVAP